MNKHDVAVVEYPVKRLIGMKVRTSMAKASTDCKALWQTFGPRTREIVPGETECRGSYGVCVMIDAEEFDYWAAIEERPSAVVAPGMERLDIPAGLYAKCPVADLSKLTEAYTYLYTGWRKGQDEYALHEAAPSLEWYPPNWSPADALEVLVPVRKR